MEGNTFSQPVATPAIPEIIPVEAVFQLLARPIPNITTMIPWSGWDAEVLGVIRRLLGLAEERGYMRAMFDCQAEDMFPAGSGAKVQSREVLDIAQDMFDNPPSWAVCEYDEPEVPETDDEWWFRY